MKKILITGCSGMLGSNLAFELMHSYDIYGIVHNTPNPQLHKSFQVDLEKLDVLADIVHTIQPDFIVHCAALTNVDACEDNYSLARQTNAIATRNLVIASGYKTRLIYISTDSVFDGTKSNYSELDLPSPLNCYAKSKLEGEWYVEQEAEHHVILRTNLFGLNRIKGQSFAEWIINSLLQRREINMFTDVIFSAVSIYSLVRFIEKLLQSDFVGRLNIGTVSPISKYDFGMHVADRFNLDRSLINPLSVDNFKFKARRPKNTSLDITKAQSLFGTMPDIAEEISLLYKYWKNKP